MTVINYGAQQALAKNTFKRTIEGWRDARCFNRRFAAIATP
jgi:hypothetical protein